MPPAGTVAAALYGLGARWLAGGLLEGVVNVSLTLAAPVNQSALPAASAGAPELVGFELTDGTVTSRAYFRDPGSLQRGIRVAGAFRDAVDELRASAPTPTPVPALVNLTAR